MDAVTLLLCRTQSSAVLKCKSEMMQRARLREITTERIHYVALHPIVYRFGDTLEWFSSDIENQPLEKSPPIT